MRVMAKQRVNWGAVVEHGLMLALYFLAAVALMALLSCQTVEAVTAAPEEFWITLEDILIALWGDIWTVVEWVL